MRGRLGGLAVGALVTVAIAAGVAGPARLAWAATAGFSVPRVDGPAGGEVVVPVRATATTELSAMQGALSYDAAVLRVVDVTAGAGLPPGARADFNADQPGFLRMGFVCSPSKGHFRGEGAVLSVRFRVVGRVGRSSDLTLSLVRAWEPNDAETLVTTTPGSVRVVDAGVAMLWIAGVPTLWIAVCLGALLLLLFLLLLRRRRPAREVPRAAAPAGSRPGNAPGTRFCTSCGTAAQAGQKFCGSCGAGLAWAPRP